MQLHYAVRGAVWVFVYLLFILAPLFMLLTGSLPPTRNFWGEFAVAIGYSGLAMMGLQFGLSARFRHVTEPWGEDVIYHFHRQISLVAVALVILHPIILVALRPQRLGMLIFYQASWRARFGALSTYCGARGQPLPHGQGPRQTEGNIVPPGVTIERDRLGPRQRDRRDRR